MSKPLSLLLFTLISSILSAYVSPSKPYAYPAIPPTRQAFRNQFKNKDFVLDLDKQANVGGDANFGNVQFANVESFPVLSGEG